MEYYWFGASSWSLAIALTLALATTFAWFLSARKEPKAIPKAKVFTFRVEKVPCNQKDDLLADISSIIQHNLVLRDSTLIETLICHSLVTRNEKYACATVSVSTYIEMSKFCGLLQTSTSKEKFHYRFDDEFDGFTPLSGGGINASVDIVVVPGLGCNALGSWKASDLSDIWPRDFLPSDIPRARVLLFGYNTKLLDSHSNRSIRDLGSHLFETLTRLREEEETSNRPIIFLGHSLGGLVIKEALVHAKRKEDVVSSNLAKSCYGLMFFGVPHLGLRNEQLRTLVGGQPNEQLISDLVVDRNEEPKPYLKSIAQQFSSNCRDYKVISIFERKLSPTLQLINGKWERTGPPILMVTEHSATSHGLVALSDEDNIAFDADHSQLVKFGDKNQPEYQIVVGRLQRLVSDAVQEVPRRFSPNETPAKPKALELSAATKECLRSLAFKNIYERKNTIDEAARSTLGWFLQHRHVKKWEVQHRGLLWIKGNPGCGKSTLMRYAEAEIPQRYGSTPLVLSFYFHGRGQEQLQKTPLGFFRSILHQLLTKFPESLTDLVETYETNTSNLGDVGETWEWEVQTLRRFLKTSLGAVLQQVPVILLVDALDEGGQEPAAELVDFLKQLASDLPFDTTCKFGIVFSCRPYPVISFEEGITIYVNNENMTDIQTFVDDCFREQPDPEIQDIICDRAQGIFLWVKLNIKRVLLLKRRGETAGNIIADIQNIPTDLDQLYKELIQDLPTPLESLKLVRWVCYALTPLGLEELQVALAIDSVASYSSLKAVEESNSFVPLDRMVNKIRTLGCGLVEVKQITPETSTVQFIHQSVRDFFIETGMKVLGQLSVSSDIFILSHHYLCMSCIQYLKLFFVSHTALFDKLQKEVNSSGRPKNIRKKLFAEEASANFPLLTYATVLWLDHAKLGDSQELGEAMLTELRGRQARRVFINPWMKILTALPPQRGGNPPPKQSLAHFAAAKGLSHVFSVIAQQLPQDLEALNNHKQTPLMLAAQIGSLDIIELLLKHDVYITYQEDEYGGTALGMACASGHKEAAALILANENWKPNAVSPYWLSPLQLATRGGHESIVKLLLNSSEFYSRYDNGTWQPFLTEAVESRYPNIAKLMIDSGKFDLYFEHGSRATLLERATSKGNYDMCKMLLDTGKLDPERKDRDKDSLLMLSVNIYQLEITRLLVRGDYGIDLNSQDVRGRTALMQSIWNPNSKITLELLATKRLNINAQDIDGSTALILVSLYYDQLPPGTDFDCNYDFLQVVAGILNYPDVDVNIRDHRGKTALAHAVEQQNLDIINILLRSGKIDFNNCDYEGSSILLQTAATSWGCRVVVPLLLDSGAVDLEGRDNMKLLSLVLWHKEFDLVGKILDSKNFDSNKNLAEIEDIPGFLEYKMHLWDSKIKTLES